MCAQFALTTNYFELAHDWALNTTDKENFEIQHHSFPQSKAPVVVYSQKENQFKLTQMSFSLIPSWSNEPKVKFATHNARIETLLEKPTWRIPTLKQHCIVPLTSFYESVHEGPLAKNIISFNSPKVIYAAGIFDCWQNQNTDEKIFSFSILTTTPSDLIRYYGHDRSPLFLSLNSSQEWLKSSYSEQNVIPFLHKNALNYDFEVKKERALKN